MMSSNLPPGTTPADVDRHAEPTETVTVYGTVTVGIEVEVGKHASDDEMKRGLEAAAVEDGGTHALEAEIDEVLR